MHVARFTQAYFQADPEPCHASGLPKALVKAKLQLSYLPHMEFQALPHVFMPSRGL